jgi:small ligand-binding sensory domain FIST
MDEYQDEFFRGDFVIRGLLGVDEERGALVAGSIPRNGQTVQFQLREAAGSSLDLQQVLIDARALVGDSEVVAGLMCTCRGRGAAMFGRSDHDACAVQGVFRDLPLAGMFSFGEIGPVRGVPALNGFAMSLGLIVHDSIRGHHG